MKILILGSSGLLGQTIIRYFLENTSYDVLGIQRDSNKISFLKSKFHKNIIINRDILDYDFLKKLITQISPDLIINCIGITNKFINDPNHLNTNFIEINSLFPHRLSNLRK